MQTTIDHAVELLRKSRPIWWMSSTGTVLPAANVLSRSWGRTVDNAAKLQRAAAAVGAVPSQVELDNEMWARYGQASG